MSARFESMALLFGVLHTTTLAYISFCSILNKQCARGNLILRQLISKYRIQQCIIHQIETVINNFKAINISDKIALNRTEWKVGFMQPTSPYQNIRLDEDDEYVIQWVVLLCLILPFSIFCCFTNRYLLWHNCVF